ncbi:MAG: hypothetical protein Q8942_02295 [Bacillota bacterium]|nr:hypothetical protein [Bacillota bacterium]
MRTNKRMIMAFSFCLGLVIFVTTAFAQISNHTGYEKLKASIKNTLKSMDQSFQNYTLSTNIIIRDNDKTILKNYSLEKQSKTATETFNQLEYGKAQNQIRHYYNDLENSISYDSVDDTYYVFNNGNTFIKSSIIPSKDSISIEIEKLFDLFIGNLKDNVLADERSDGSIEFSGSINEGQIPPIINALISFEFKKQVTDRAFDSDDSKFPQLSDDLFLKSVKGNAITNKDGIIIKLDAECVISGKNFNGEQHDLNTAFSAKLLDINSTEISKPDLKGKKVEKINPPQYTNLPGKFAGLYKNDIVIDKDGHFLKIGERFVELTRIDDNNFIGHYYEKYNKDYEDYKGRNREFQFIGSIPDSSTAAEYKYADSKGNEKIGSINFDTINGKISFNNYGNQFNHSNFDNNFYRIFD